MAGRFRRILAIIIWTVFVVVFGLGYYVNHYLPHGPRYPTGEVVCQNDDRGPCGEEYREDLSNLNIPDWAKFFRGSGDLLLLIGLAVAAIVISNKRKEESEGPISPALPQLQQPAPLRYPYIVRRMMSAVYTQIPVVYVANEQEKPHGGGITIVDPQPWVDGKLTAYAREVLVAIVSRIVVDKKERLCVIFGENDCVYCEPDGTAQISSEPPSGGAWV